MERNVVLHCPACLHERGVLIQYASRQKHCAVCQSENLEPLHLADDEQELPGTEEVLRDPSASRWLKDALQSALVRDPVDAANDAEILARLLDRQCRVVLKS
jgi:hypothetical protein